MSEMAHSLLQLTATLCLTVEIVSADLKSDCEALSGPSVFYDDPLEKFGHGCLAFFNPTPKKNVTEAEKFCRSIGANMNAQGQLVILESSAEVTNVRGSLGISNQFWLAAYQNDTSGGLTQHWYYKHDPVMSTNGVAFGPIQANDDFWYSNQPNEPGQCAYVSSDKLFDGPCTTGYGVDIICEIRHISCSQVPCYNGGTCIENATAVPHRFRKCVCSPGVTGVDCQSCAWDNSTCYHHDKKTQFKSSINLRNKEGLGSTLEVHDNIDKTSCMELCHKDCRCRSVTYKSDYGTCKLHYATPYIDCFVSIDNPVAAIYVEI